MKTLWMIGCLLPLAASGQLVITEINSNGTPADFWELTNFGTAAVDLGGYVWTDSSGVVFNTVPTGTSIASHESIVFVTGLDEATFRTAWGLAPTVKIFATANPGLGQNDAAKLYVSATAPTPLLTLSYAAGGFTCSNGTAAVGGHAGLSAGGTANTQSLIMDPNFGPAAPRYTFATGGNFSSWQAPGGTQTGSPGMVGTAATNSAPYFTGTDQAFAAVGQDLSTLAFRVQAADADLGQAVTYTLTAGPTWLTLADDGPDNAMLVGTPQAGVHPFTVRATDNNPSAPAATERSYLLYVPPVASPVLLNEYNAVNSSKFLNGGTVELDNDLGAAADLHFGRVLENGGDWFELVVVGTGGPGAVDLRGWRIVLSQTAGGATTTSATIVLSQAPYWAAVPTGTLLTFIERNADQGGHDTGIEIRNNRGSVGDSWSNIWLGDPTYLTYTDAATNGYTVIDGVVGGIALDEKETRILLKNAAGTLMAGPFGEGVPPGVEVGDTEVFALNADPAPAVSPLVAADATLGIPGFKDKSNRSSFGRPNEWSLVGQSFIAYARPLTPYETWAAGFALADPSPDADPDADGRNNGAEYGFGGNPGVVDGPAPGAALVQSGGTVTWQYARRGDDLNLLFTHQRSTNLSDWPGFTPPSLTTAPHPSLAGFVIATVQVPANPVNGKEFFRARMSR